MRLLLDTCTFLWVTGEPGKLSRNAAELFQDSGNEIFLSAASGWEIAVKSSIGRLSLPEPAWRFVPACRELHRIDPLPIDEEAALQTERLPRVHNDPFDRMLVCQAIVHGLTILTPDPLIAQYAVRVIW